MAIPKRWKLRNGKSLRRERKRYKEEYHEVHIIPLNKINLRLYDRIGQANREMWSKTEKEVLNGI